LNQYLLNKLHDSKKGNKIDFAGRAAAGQFAEAAVTLCIIYVMQKNYPMIFSVLR